MQGNLAGTKQEGTTKNGLHLTLVRESQAGSQFHASASPYSSLEHFHPSILASVLLTWVLMQIWGGGRGSCGHRAGKKPWSVAAMESATAMESAMSSRVTSKDSCYILVLCPQLDAAHSLTWRGADQQRRVPGKSQQGSMALLNTSSLQHFQLPI